MLAVHLLAGLASATRHPRLARLPRDALAGEAGEISGRVRNKLKRPHYPSAGGLDARRCPDSNQPCRAFSVCCFWITSTVSVTFPIASQTATSFAPISEASLTACLIALSFSSGKAYRPE